MDKLETPDDTEALYLARGAEVDPCRPTFTGDVVDFADRRVLLLQHPCAMRRGGRLAQRLLAATVQSGATIPQDWHASYRKMFLPALDGPGNDSLADFDDLLVLDGAVISRLPRLATLSEVGVAYLMQRWVYHNTRVRVPTRTFVDTLAPQTEEADLEADWVSHYVDGRGMDREVAAVEFNAWLDENQRGRRDKLMDAAGRASVRREQRAHLSHA